MPGRGSPPTDGVTAVAADLRDPEAVLMGLHLRPGRAVCVILGVLQLGGSPATS